MTKGIERFRQAIKNQRDLGNGDFCLTYGAAEKIAAEIEDELARLAWAKGVPAPLDANGCAVPLDTKELVYRGEAREVFAFSYNTRHGCWGVYFAGGDGISLNACTLPDSWEKLEEDVRNAENGGACGYYGMGTDPCNEGCPGYKDLQAPCAAIALKDALLRAEALAGRDVMASAPQPSPHGAEEADRG